MILYAILSEPGDREINEDSVGLSREGEGFLFALADGLGGHGHGEVASAIAVEASLRVFSQREGAGDDLLPMCIVEGQNELITQQRALGVQTEMKTTQVLLHIAGDAARWAHVGDSRLYWFKKDKLLGRTLDHSVPQMLVSQGELREKDIRFHEDRNRLIRVLGMDWDSPKYDLSDAYPIAPPLSFLLCSDGFWELIDEKEMAKQLHRAAGPQEWLDAMKAIVLKNGRGKNMDNFSAIAVFVR